MQKNQEQPENYGAKHGISNDQKTQADVANQEGNALFDETNKLFDLVNSILMAIMVHFVNNLAILVGQFDISLKRKKFNGKLIHF